MYKEYKSRGIRLLKKGQRGIAHAVFSRFGLILLMLAGQIVILFSIFRWFEEFLPHIIGGTALFTFVIVIGLLNSQMNPTAKITWLIAVMLLPVFGVLLFVYTQSDFGHIALKTRTGQIMAETKACIPQQADTMAQFEKADRGAASLSHYIQRSGCIHADSGCLFSAWRG